MSNTIEIWTAPVDFCEGDTVCCVKDETKQGFVWEVDFHHVHVKWEDGSTSLRIHKTLRIVTPK